MGFLHKHNWDPISKYRYEHYRKIIKNNLDSNSEIGDDK